MSADDEHLDSVETREGNRHRSRAVNPALRRAYDKNAAGCGMARNHGPAAAGNRANLGGSQTQVSCLLSNETSGHDSFRQWDSLEEMLKSFGASTQPLQQKSDLYEKHLLVRTYKKYADERVEANKVTLQVLQARPDGGLGLRVQRRSADWAHGDEDGRMEAAGYLVGDDAVVAGGGGSGSAGTSSGDRTSSGAGGVIRRVASGAGAGAGAEEAAGGEQPGGTRSWTSQLVSNLTSAAAQGAKATAGFASSAFADIHSRVHDQDYYLSPEEKQAKSEMLVATRILADSDFLEKVSGEIVSVDSLNLTCTVLWNFSKRVESHYRIGEFS